MKQHVKRILLTAAQGLVVGALLGGLLAPRPRELEGGHLLTGKGPGPAAPPGLVDPPPPAVEPCSDEAHRQQLELWGFHLELEGDAKRPAAPAPVPGRDLIRPRKGLHVGDR